MLHTCLILTSVRLHEKMVYGCMLVKNIVIFAKYMNWIYNKYTKTLCIIIFKFDNEATLNVIAAPDE